MAAPNERISQYTKPGRRESRPSHQGHSPEPSGARKVYEQAQDLVREKPGYAIMAVFGVGLGLGLLIAAMSPKKERRTKFQDYLGENARDTIQSAVARFVPEAVSRFLAKHS